MDNKEQLTFEVNKNAIAEIVNFSPEKSWIRWFLPDFSDNGNIDLPVGNYKEVRREGDKMIIEQI